ncbi:citryl-CoA lyase [Nonomuraea gerenzanensis]|uniref:citrate synthase (unknown stereospecificity) n=1 Tax=Nonomuraea gerenzanensis TaxID=93944 RepID=A0A1M4EG70_9ACTN|nr:citryl-CoA lyase [Nonomuraea gerenzanensis]UBU09406.1 citryl-CoA lyase [Nonomuraea gerenzanensis]SBO97820.1 Citrate synthase (si) [Nonomuraea gerenzanensis]
MSGREAAADWWGTAVSRVEPDVIELRGQPVQDLIGRIGFAELIWLMLRGERPGPRQAALLEAALVSSVDHGPHAPSIAVARMAVTCGVGLNNAVATGVNLLGDVHGGAGEQCVRLLEEVAAQGGPGGGSGGGDSADGGAAAVVARWRARDKYLPGFGHRFHTRDPRRDPLLGLVSQAVADGVVAGAHLRAAIEIERLIAPVPMNIDGATAVVYAELGFPAPLARGLFVLSRSVGILAHAWEESGQGRRNKGPIPPSILPTWL